MPDNELLDAVREALAGVVDPEIKRPITELGMVESLSIDDDDVVVEGSRLNGVTVFSRFRPLEGCAGVSIRNVDALADRRHPKSVRQAIANARHNFMVVSEGLVPEEPPGPITRLLNRSPRTGPVTA